MPVRLNIIMEEAVYKRLKRQVPAKRMSAFINEAVRTTLRPDKKALDAAYKAARMEAWRSALSEDWIIAETEGWPE
jgi:Pyruvate/2-oxoacid:ferredoxin oxidoreductase gamma subunit